MRNSRQRTIFVLAILLLLLIVPSALADTIYTIQAGDTLGIIAQKHNVTVQAIIQANSIINPNLIFAGQQLTIPDGNDDGGGDNGGDGGGETITYTVQSGDTLNKIAVKFNTTVSAIAAANNLTNINFIYVGQTLIVSGSGNDGGGDDGGGDDGGGDDGGGDDGGGDDDNGGQSTTYTVQPGDSMGKIAAKFGVTVSAIAAANNITNINYIYVGQVLTIPGATGGGDTGGGDNGGGDAAGFALGGQTQTFANPNRMKESGMTWVKFQHKWTKGDSASALADRISSAHANGFKVLLSIPGSATYPTAGSIDFSSYTNFLGGLAALPDPPDAIEVWNEMNIDFEWPAGEIDPAAYVNNMLRPAYLAIKAANSSVMVVSGAPAPTGFDNSTNAWADDRYMAGMAAAGGANYMDCIGVHHNAGATSPSASSGHSGGSHYSWYFWPTLNMYYNAFGGAKNICFTELGYLTSDGYPQLPANFAWAGNNSLQNHADWLAEAVSLSANSGKVDMLIIFNVDFTHYDPNGDPQAGYAIIRADGNCPACATLAGVMGN